MTRKTLIPVTIDKTGKKAYFVPETGKLVELVEKEIEFPSPESVSVEEIVKIKLLYHQGSTVETIAKRMYMGIEKIKCILKGDYDYILGDSYSEYEVPQKELVTKYKMQYYMNQRWVLDKIRVMHPKQFPTVDSIRRFCAVYGIRVAHTSRPVTEKERLDIKIDIQNGLTDDEIVCRHNRSVRTIRGIRRDLEEREMESNDQPRIVQV